MSARVVFAEGFRSDLTAQTRRLLADGKPEWAERVMAEIEQAAALLATFPQAGPAELRRGRREVRRLLLRRLPFVIWYSFQARSKKAIVVRLFHVKQRAAG